MSNARLILKLLIIIINSTNFITVISTEAQVFGPNFSKAIDTGELHEHYETQMPFSIEGEQFFLGQKKRGFFNSNRFPLFIRKFLPGGFVGPNEAYQGEVNDLYESLITFNISGRHFFYGQSVDKKWFIQELLPGGSIGLRTDNGSWSYYYSAMFAFSINEKQYFYCQSKHNWFIQELLAGGKMGIETDNGASRRFYKVQIPFSIDGRQFFFGHDRLRNQWFIRELLPLGKMGGETDSGYFDRFYDQMFTYKANSRTFVFGFSRTRSVSDLLGQSGECFVNELLPGGKLGPVLSQCSRNNWLDVLHPIFSYSINGRSFVYSQDYHSNRWFTQEIII